MIGLIFDMDGTLVRSSGCHEKSLTHAIEKVYGARTCLHEVDHKGRTDQAIIMDLLRLHGISDFSKIPDVIRIMGEFFMECGPPPSEIDGVREALSVLRRRFLLGLGTGNIEPIAWGKLSKIGLRDYFSFGGFGSDAIRREDVIRIAVERGTRAGAKGFVVVGDTPRDISAARLNGLPVVAVTTGSYSASDLAEADMVLGGVWEMPERADEIEEMASLR